METKKGYLVAHNLVKLKAFYFLSLNNWSTAGEIASGTDSNPAGLYVLLSRWKRWGFVVRNIIYQRLPDGKYIPQRYYRYSLTDKGKQYLTKARVWYKDYDLALGMVDDIGMIKELENPVKKRVVNLNIKGYSGLKPF